MYPEDLGMPGEGYEAREFPYRKMFGLQPRFGTPHTQNSDGTYGAGHETESLMKELVPKTPEARDAQTFTPLMGNTLLDRTPDGSYNYRDRWDLDLNPGERVNSVTGVLRYLMSKLTTPVTFAGNIKP